MKDFLVGIQVYSVRDEAAKDFAGTLKELKKMGYDGVELAGLYGLSAAEVRKAAEDADIQIFSAHVPLDDLRKDPKGTVSIYREIGCRWIAVPYLMPEDRPQSGSFEKTIADIRIISEECRKQGIDLLYHNHDFEFFRMDDGRYALDVLYDSIPADLLKTELDTCWVHVSGVDPCAYIRKYSGRTPLVHLKDYDGERSEDMYALIGIQRKPNPNAKPFGFRPVGSGKMPMADVVKAAGEAGAQWLVVEQDEPEPGVGRMPSAEKSIRYLKEILK